MTIYRKFNIFIFLSTLILITAFGISYSYLEHKADRERMKTVAFTVGQIIEDTISVHMRMDDRKELAGMLDHYSHLARVRDIRITDMQGYVKVATDGELVNTRVEASVLERSGITEGGTITDYGRKHRWVQAIENGPECFRCHPSDGHINGFIVINFQEETYEGLIGRRFSFVNGVIIFISMLVAVSMYYFVQRLIIKRLAVLDTIIGRFRNGEKDVQVETGGNDEIARLGAQFNELINHLSHIDTQREILFTRILLSKQEWQRTFDAILDMIIIHDDGMKILQVNRAFAEYFGVSPKDVVDRHLPDIPVLEGELISFISNVNNMVIGEGRVKELVDKRTDSIFNVMIFPLNSSPEMVRDETYGQCWIHVIRDVTEEKDREMQLILNERLASLGRMASGIAHEINNPLAAISGCAEGLLSRIKKNKYDRKHFARYLDIIGEEVGRCKKITTSMLSFVKKQDEGRKKVDVAAVIDSALEVIAFQKRLDAVEVRRDYRGQPTDIQCSEGEIRQALIIIIANALDAMDEKGVLSISTRTEGKGAVIKIRDTGSGISEEDLGRIFDPFFTTRSDAGGVGLGLSIAKKIVDNHKSRIGVSSLQGRGTTFTISLPL